MKQKPITLEINTHFGTYPPKKSETVPVVLILSFFFFEKRKGLLAGVKCSQD